MKQDVYKENLFLKNSRMTVKMARNKQKLSKLISESFCVNGISSLTTKLLKKSKTLLTDYLYSYSTVALNSTRCDKIYCGSSAEGTATVSSDVDVMIIDPFVLVTTDAEDIPDRTGISHVFYMDTSKSYNGYTRLRLQNVRSTHKLGDTDFSTFFVETGGESFLSSEKIVDYLVSVPSKKQRVRHGPCSTLKHVDIPGLCLESETSFALKCTSWPQQARRWVLRKRKDWPPADLILKICMHPCHVVSMGDKRSKYFSQEWRISYVVGERELIWSLNDCQLQSYVMMKMLLKKYLVPIANDQLSSYHLKTIIFWLSEELGYAFWYPENLIDSVHACLSKLAVCVQKKELPHYFNPDVNLFRHKFECASEKKNIVKKISDIQFNITYYILECLQLEITPCAGNISFIELINTGEKQEGYFEKMIKFNYDRNLYREMLHIYFRITCYRDDSMLLISQTRTLENNPPFEVESTFIEHTKICLMFRTGVAYFRQKAFDDDLIFGICTQDLTKDNAINLISNIVHIDALTGTLLFASLHSYMGNYGESLKLVSSLLKQDKYLIYPGFESQYFVIQLNKSGDVKSHALINDQMCKERTFAAYDVAFSYKDTFFVPYPVKFECALAECDNYDEHLILFHPSVYAYFLLFWNQYMLKDYSNSMKTLHKLQKAVDDTRFGLSRYHALNILAYCYILTSNFVQAFQCYKESLQETCFPYRAVNNAAAYHVAIILSMVINSK